MRLKKLQLQGFKSFAGKTSLDFPLTGVVAIVGPNGSGKSNVIDAIRWLLGEREAKNLRGAKSDDLIFSGTDGRTRVGMAEASIYFENNDDASASPFSEFAVTRKIFRDGTSHYFLNKTETRLKDVIDFFAASKLGSKGFTIINQGNSDVFVRAAPAERRGMIEEILGLKSFELRRHDAELKLKNTASNLEKIQASFDELLPRLKLLRRQASKWAERENIQKELRDFEDKYFGAKLKELDAELQKILPESKRIISLIENKDSELRVLNLELQKLRKENDGGGSRNAVNEEIPLARRRSELEREMGRLEAKLEFVSKIKPKTLDESKLLSALEAAKSYIQKARELDDIKGIKQMLDEAARHIDKLFSEDKDDSSGELREIKAAKEKIIDELKEIEMELSKIEGENREAAKKMADFNKSFQNIFKAVEAKKDELNSLLSQSQKLRFDEERVLMKKGDLESQIRQINRSPDEFARAPLVTLTVEFFASAERRMLKLRGDLAAIGEIDEALLSEAKGAEERYTFLSVQLEDLKKASTDLNILIKDLSFKIKSEFGKALVQLNERFLHYFKLMFGGGRAKLVTIKNNLQLEEGVDASLSNSAGLEDEIAGLDIEVSLPKKGARSLDVLSGGEKSLVSIAALFALVSISPPPFLVLDEVDAALDENNTRRFATLIKEFSKDTQFIIVTHNRATMEAADILYGVTMGADGASKILSVKLA